MKTIVDQATRQQLIVRVNSLDENNSALWGKMNVYEMILHCILFEEMLLGKKKFKRVFVGRLFGKMALKSIIGNDNPPKRNMPTFPEIKVSLPTSDFMTDKQKWIDLLKEHEVVVADDIIHPFFGKLSPEQVGYLSYKHTDHHLRQFNC